LDGIGLSDRLVVLNEILSELLRQSREAQLSERL
jgi:hypothetical protein